MKVQSGCPTFSIKSRPEPKEDDRSLCFFLFSSTRWLPLILLLLPFLNVHGARKRTMKKRDPALSQLFFNTRSFTLDDCVVLIVSVFVYLSPFRKGGAWRPSPASRLQQAGPIHDLQIFLGTACDGSSIPRFQPCSIVKGRPCGAV